MNPANNEIWRKEQTVRVTGLSWSTIRRYEKAGDFPQRIKLGKRSVGHLASEVYSWMANRERVVIQGEV